MDKSYVDKAWSEKSAKEVADAGVEALYGISEEGAEKIKKVLNAKTVKELAECKYVKWAQEIVSGKSPDKAWVDKAYEGKNASEVADAPVAALQGISDDGGKQIASVLHIKTIKDLANAKFVKWAQEITKEANS